MFEEYQSKLRERAAAKDAERAERDARDRDREEVSGVKWEGGGQLGVRGRTAGTEERAGRTGVREDG